MREAVARNFQQERILVDYNLSTRQFEVHTSNATCLELEVRKDGRILGTGIKTGNDFAAQPDVGVHIYVAQLRKCPPLSGSKIMTGLLDALAACVDGAQTIGLLDAAQLYVRQRSYKPGVLCNLDYSPFLMLATGDTYYNQFGFFSTSHDADKRHNASLIDQAFGTTVAELLNNYQQYADDEEKEWLVNTITNAVLGRPSSLRDLFGIEHLDYASSTRQIFSAIRESKAIHEMVLDEDDCSDPAFVWIRAVVTLFTYSRGGLRFDQYLEKPVVPAAVTDDNPQDKKKRTRGGQQRQTRRRRRYTATTMRRKSRHRVQRQ